ncbi:hypothetical protein VTN96DRAFT_9566 [Rasamsonia emersonii]
MQSPPSPINVALNQLIKGCQLAMNSAVILAKENHDLQAANEKQKQKRKRSTNQISHEGDGRGCGRTGRGGGFGTSYTRAAKVY